MENIKENAALFKALGDENRLQILEMLHDGELCACKLLEELGIGQPTLSHHMKILCATGLVKGRKEGRWVHYSIDGEAREAALERLAAVLGTKVSIAENHHTKETEHSDTDNKTDLYLLTGFLGAGKTTMLVNLLDKLDGKKVGVIQNDFGKLNIDGDIIRRGGVEMVEIGRGSVFCSCLRKDFAKGMAEMSKKGLDCLFVESSGLADPSNLEEILRSVAGICGGTQPYALSGAICLVDGVDFLKDVETEETARRQVKYCSLALLNKRDLIDEAQASAVYDRIRSINPYCMIVETIDGVIPPALLQQDLRDYRWAEAEETSNTPESKPKTFSIECDVPVAEEKLCAFLRSVLGDAYRIKGFFELEGKGWQQVDVVGDRIDIKPCGDMGVSRMMFISRTGIALIRSIKENWDGLVGCPVKLKN